jgi:hypothetical protein
VSFIHVIEHVFNDHRRTVNRVCFHDTEHHLLLSGSQDGFMKLFVCVYVYNRLDSKTLSLQFIGGWSQILGHYYKTIEDINYLSIMEKRTPKMANNVTSLAGYDT